MFRRTCSGPALSPTDICNFEPWKVAVSASHRPRFSSRDPVTQGGTFDRTISAALYLRTEPREDTVIGDNVMKYLVSLRLRGHANDSIPPPLTPTGAQRLKGTLAEFKYNR